MWRDILITVALIFSILTYFRLTPRRLSGYFNTAKSATTRKLYPQRIIQGLLVISTIVIAIEIIIKYDELQLSTIFLVTASHIIFLYIMTFYTLSLSSRGTRIIRIVAVAVFLLFLVAGISLADIPIWRKIVMPISGFVGGFAVRRLIDYMTDRIKSRQTTQGD